MKEVFMFCNSCGKYTEHVCTAPNIARCTVCGYGQWTAWNEEVREE